MMKVALIYFDSLKRGGYPRDIRWLSSALARLNVEVFLVSKGGNVFEGLNEKVSILNPYEFLEKMDMFDITHFFGFFVKDHVQVLKQVSKRKKIFIISPLSHIMPFALYKNKIKKYMFIYYIKNYLKKAAIHVLSPLEEKVIKNYLDVDRIFTGTLGIYPVNNKINNNKSQKNKDVFKLLFFGRNDIYQKGIDILLKSIKITNYKNQNIKLKIAGKSWGKSKKYISEFIKNNNLSNVVDFVGEVNDLQKEQLYNEMDYLIYLSRFDGPPRPIREAISYGKPVIVSPETNMGHLIYGYNAGVQVNLNPYEISQNLLSIYSDYKIIKKHQAGAIALKNRLSWDIVAIDYLKGYEWILKSK